MANYDGDGKLDAGRHKGVVQVFNGFGITKFFLTVPANTYVTDFINHERAMVSVKRRSTRVNDALVTGNSGLG